MDKLVKYVGLLHSMCLTREVHMTYDCPLQSLIYFHVQFRVSSPFRKLEGRSLYVHNKSYLLPRGIADSSF